MASNSGSTRRHLPTSPFQPAAAAPRQDFAPEDRVTHDRHGMGTVVSSTADGMVTVRFSSGEVRLVNGVKLDKL